MISLLAAELALSAWGPLAGTEVTDTPAQGAKKMLLIRHAPACGVPRTKAPRVDELGYGQISLSYSLYRFLVRTKSHKARHKAAGSALSVKLEKYLSRPDYEGHISFIETLHEGLPQNGIGCPRGIRTPRC